MPPRRNPVTRPNALEIGNVKDDIHPEPVDISVYKVVHSGRVQVMDAIGQLVSALDCNRVARQPALGLDCFLKGLCSNHLDSFERICNHINVETWQNNMEELLSTTRCTDEQKLNEFKLAWMS